MLPFLLPLRTFTVHQLARSLTASVFSFVVNFVVTARGGFTGFYFLSAARSLVWGCVALSVVAVPLLGSGVAPWAWVAAVLCGWLLVKVLLGLSAVPGAIVGSRCCIQNERKFALDTVVGRPSFRNTSKGSATAAHSTTSPNNLVSVVAERELQSTAIPQEADLHHGRTPTANCSDN